MVQALNSAMDVMLGRDPDVVLFGEDVAKLGGVFGATRGLARRFGEERVFDTPVSETAFLGMAVGAAQAGLRPVVELMFGDFLLVIARMASSSRVRAFTNHRSNT